MGVCPQRDCNQVRKRRRTSQIELGNGVRRVSRAGARDRQPSGRKMRSARLLGGGGGIREAVSLEL